jgi:hypothetical protein
MGDYIQAVHNSTHGPPRRAKRKMVVNRVSEAVGSTSRVHQKSATRTLEGYHRISEAAGRGAGRLAAPNAHEVYHEFLPGPSVQQELVVTTAQGELPWIEGSEEEATLNHINSVVPQQDIVNSANDGERANVEGGRLQIPKRLSARQMGLLEATPDDWARGTVRALKCRLCPRAAFNGWEGYRRHCDVNEAHPVKLSFCNFCGDFFARTDALARHRTSRPDECREAKKDEAKAKRMATEQLHKEFEGQLVCYLETNKAIGEPFSQRVKAMFPKSSKRGSRQQNRLNRRRA